MSAKHEVYNDDDDNVDTHLSFTAGGSETFRAANVLRPLQYTDTVSEIFQVSSNIFMQVVETYSKWHKKILCKFSWMTSLCVQLSSAKNKQFSCRWRTRVTSCISANGNKNKKDGVHFLAHAAHTHLGCCLLNSLESPTSPRGANFCKIHNNNNNMLTYVSQTRKRYLMC